MSKFLIANPRLFHAAVAFSKAFKDAGGFSILVGGAASIALGNDSRQTKVNLSLE